MLAIKAMTHKYTHSHSLFWRLHINQNNTFANFVRRHTSPHDLFGAPVIVPQQHNGNYAVFTRLTWNAAFTSYASRCPRLYPQGRCFHSCHAPLFSRLRPGREGRGCAQRPGCLFQGPPHGAGKKPLRPHVSEE